MKFTVNNSTYELILIHVSGSRLYGNSTETSDWDYRGVFIAGSDTKLGLLGRVEQLEGKDVYNALVKAGLSLVQTDDVVLYEINRFAELAIDQNPNIIDTVFCTEDSRVYCNDKGKMLINNNSLFLSTKLKFTFSGYAMSQLKRIKSHNKWINEFPETDLVLRLLKEASDKMLIDYHWVCNNFGGEVANKVTDKDKLLTNQTISWEQFQERVASEIDQKDLERYRIPRLISYCKAFDLKAKILNQDNEITLFDHGYGGTYFKGTIRELLTTNGSFRTLGDSMITLYTAGRGIFGEEGNIKKNDPEHIGEFICLIRIHHHDYKSDTDHVRLMWEWKCKRNEARGSLEEKFGYDTKHASHLVRLMIGAKHIITEGQYNPQLVGEELQLVKDVRAGEYTYEWITEFADTLDKELEELYKTSTLPKKVDIKAVHKLVLNLQKELISI